VPLRKEKITSGNRRVVRRQSLPQRIAVIAKGLAGKTLQDWQWCMRRPRKRTVLTSSIDRQPSGAAMGFLRKEAVQKWGVSERWDRKGLNLLLSFETDCEDTLSS
jgi:hypothetical protein